jgi:hypothetical protein
VRHRLLVLGLVAACAEPRVSAVASAPGRSNVRSSDYVGPDTCGDCHDDKHAQWSQSLHASMNRRVDDATLLGDFDDVELAWAGGTVRFSDTGGPAMELRPAGRPARRFRITRTIGSRHLQEYVGVQVAGPEPAGDPIYATEVRLPFGWWVRGGGWFHQQYFDSWYGPESTVDPYAIDPTPWATRCAWCHNTYPFELRAMRRVGSGLEAQLVPAVLRDDPAARAVIADNLLPVDELVTVGISCESCHLGGRAHAEEEAPISFVPVHPALAPRPDAPDLSGGRDDPFVVNAICAQCHSTPADRWPDGGVTRNSSEAFDLAAGACASAIACTDCHDPHGAPPRDACAGCHADLAPDHARHPAGVASCLDCHMPRMVQGIGAVVRRHRISSPTDEAMLAAAAPNACNLCHLDRSIRWTLDAIDAGWGRRIAPGDWAWPDLDAPAGEVWLDGDHRATRIAAAAAYARSPLGPAALPRLRARLDDPIAYDRMWIRFAVEEIATGGDPGPQ